MSLSKRLLPFVGVAGIAALAACGTSTTTPSGSGGGGGIASCRGSITVASDLPLTGGDATDGPPVQKAIQLAVEQANAKKVLGGCTLKYESKDDATVLKNGHDPAQGAANITALASDSSVMGVVGPFNSSVAVAEIPVASQNHLVLISPSNTNPGLTVAGTNADLDTNSLYAGGTHSYFRVIGTDITQGEITAYVATKELNATKVYTIDDQETYGKGLVIQFTKAYTADGGTVVGSASLPGTTKDFKTQIADAQNKGAQAIFFGGTSGNGCGVLRSQMPATLPELGGDGCQDDKFVTDAGSNAPGAEVTSAPDASKLSSASTFYSDFKTRWGEDGTESPYTPYGYDAMNILIEAIKTVLINNGGNPPSDSQTFRDDVAAALHASSFTYKGATGTTSFDQNGDTTNAGFSLYTISGGKWVAKELLTADASGKVTVST